MTTPIANGRNYFTATTYTGTGASQTITNTGFYPDLIWTKCRNVGHNNVLQDFVRGFGSGKNLNSNNALAQGTDNDGYPTAASSTGFTANGGNGTNSNSNSYVAWQWNAASGTSTTNTSGSITSQVSVNTTSGFSIVTYTGNGSGGATIGHGLGVTPSVVVVKGVVPNGAGPQNWDFYHSSMNGGTNPAQYLMQWNAQSGKTGQSSVWNDTAPTSSVFTVGTSGDTNYSGATYVAYCWAPVFGYSSFGSYTGNGSSAGPFINTGFRPAYVMIKYADTSGGTDWVMYDSTRNPYNATTNSLFTNAASSEGTPYTINLLSNGFQITTSFTSNLNDNGIPYVYMAFAENPLKYANAF